MDFRWFHLALLFVGFNCLIGHNVGTPISFDEEQNEGADVGILVSNGTEASSHEFPWLVSLQWEAGHFCTGAIIYAGLDRLSESNNDNYTSIVQRRIPLTYQNHPQWGTGPMGISNDISVLRLAQGFEFDEFVNSIQLPGQGQVATGQAIIAGWGSKGEELIGLQDHVMRGFVTILSDSQCRAVYGDDYNPDTMLCAVSANGADFCNGDIGAPLIAKDSQGTTFLAGLASWGKGCGNPSYPGVYTKISAFLDFIQ